MSYTLTLTEQDVDTIAWVGGRYSWSDALSGYEAGTHEIPEHEAWAVREAIEADCEGGHRPFPCLDPRSDLAEKLGQFWDATV